MAAGPKVLYEFGPFRVDPEKQVLLRKGHAIPLTPKAFETLLILLRNSREIVSKDELMRSVWPDSFVEEGNLSQNIFLLRKALGDTLDDKRYIVTLPGRGYRFTADVRTVAQEGDNVVLRTHSRSQILYQARDSKPVSEVSGGITGSVNASDGRVGQGSSDPAIAAETRRWVSLTSSVAVGIVLLASLLYGYNSLQQRKNQRKRSEAEAEYQVGRGLWKQRHADDISKAIEHYQKAIAIDPTYAPAYSGLADAYLALPLYSSIPKDVLFPKALSSAEKAVEFDPNLAEAHISLGDAKAYSGDLPGADPEYRRGLELDPNYATGHQWYANYLSLMGRHEEAVQHILQAQSLEPLSLIMYHNAGQIYYNARQYNLAIAQFNKALQMDPGFYPACIRLADALRQQGKYREALETELEFYKHRGTSIRGVGTDQTNAERLLHAFEAGGKKGYWRTRLELQKESTNDGLTTNDGGPLYALAIDYTQNGDKDQAISLLAKIVERRDWDMYHFKTEPDLDPLRSDSRFVTLLRDVGFQQ